MTPVADSPRSSPPGPTNRLAWLLAGILFAPLSAPAQTATEQERQEKEEESPEEERGTKLPVLSETVVVTASRVESPLLTAPAAIAVRTARGTRFGGRAHLCRPLRRHSGHRHSGERPPDHRIAEHPRLCRPAGGRAPGRGTAELQRRPRREILHRSGPPPARRSPPRSQLGGLRQRSPRRSGVTHHPERA